MIIKLENRIVWDTELNTQSDEANEWFRKNILDKMAFSPNWESEYVQPEYDNFQRPLLWHFDFENFSVHIMREYIHPNSSSWASKSDKIEFIKH